MTAAGLDGRDELSAVTEFGRLFFPKGRVPVDLHRHQAVRQLDEEPKQLQSVRTGAGNIETLNPKATP